MKSQHIPMTIDEFHLMPYELGWKYEYWGGEAHISPKWINVVKTTVPVKPRPVIAPCAIRPLTETDLPKFIPAYVAGFRDAADYCDYSLAYVKRAAISHMRNFFAGNRGIPHPASQIAIRRGCIVGAVLITERKDQRCLLDLLFVRPNQQRQGLATALVATALNHLSSEGREWLTSRYLLANAASRDWHHRFGFNDERDAYLARAYYHTMAHNIEVLEAKGVARDETYQGFIEARDYWKDQIGKLDPYPAVLDWV
jgi:GNAT superfamily N-acetyltransferase